MSEQETADGKGMKIMIATRLTLDQRCWNECQKCHSPEQNEILEAELDITVVKEQLYSPSMAVRSMCIAL